MKQNHKNSRSGASAQERKMKFARIIVVLLIAAVVLTYSVSFVGYLF